MKLKSRSVFAGAVSAALTLALAACDDRPDATSTGPELAVAPAACDIPSLRQAASRYFTLNADAQTAQNIIKALAAATGATRTARGFDLLALLQKVTDENHPHGTPTQGAATAKLTFPCMPTLSPQPPANLDLTAAFAAGGAFGVVGTGSTPVLAKPVGSPLWGLEPSIKSGTTRYTWAELVSGRIVIYGAPFSGFQSNEAELGPAFDWATIPSGLTFAQPATVGYCNAPNTRALLQHLQLAQGEIVPFEQPSYCSSTVGADLAPNGHGLLGLMRRAARAGLDLVRPTPLHAAFALVIGGKKKTLSPFGVVDAQSLVLAFATQPKNAKTTTPLAPFTVTLEGAGGTPLAGVPVAVTISGNNGSYVFTENGVAVASVTAITDENGTATFSTGSALLIVDKPGGYTLRATVSGYSPLAGYAAPTTVSAMFHITQ